MSNVERVFSWKTIARIQNDHYAKRTHRQAQYGEIIMLADDSIIQDGTVTDTKKGGIGFRNSTIPEKVCSA